MVEVELVGDEPPGAGPPPEPVVERLRRALAPAVRGARRATGFVVPRAVRAWRRPAVRWIALGVVAALVAVPVVNASRERTRLAALARIPGILRPLHPGMTARYVLGAEDAGALILGTLVGGTLVSSPVTQGTATAPGGAPPLVGIDPATGERRWSTTVPPVDPAGVVEAAPACGAADDLAVCVAQETVAGRHPTSLWVLDPSDGRVLRSATVGEHGSALVAGGQLVVARQVDGPDRAPASGPWAVTWQVTGQDAATGAVRWTWTSPPVGVVAVAEEQNLDHDPADYAWWLYAPRRSLLPGDAAVLSVGDDRWVLSADGAVRTHLAGAGGWTVWEARGAVVREPAPTDVDNGAQGPLEMLLADGRWQPVDGEEMWAVVDDGSAPGVVFLVSGDEVTSSATLTAVDSGTGAVLWSAPVPATMYAVNGMVLGGRLYVAAQALNAAGENRVTAYDATTGAVAWTRQGPGAGLLATDGTVLLAPGPDGSPNSVQAYALDDGRPLWQDDLRDAVYPAGVTPGNLSGVTALQAVPYLGAVRVDGSITVLG